MPVKPMKLLHLHALPDTLQLPPTAITIGNFDGVHLGHQAMLRMLKKTAQAENLKTLVMLFEPQPLEFFKGTAAPPRITSLREKIELLRELDIDYVVTAKFDDAFRSLSARAFADILKTPLNGKALVLGDDFRFGHDRTGDSNFLRGYGFPIESMDTFTIEGERVSSTRIRQILQQGDFQAAARLLGRPYSITGRVQYGDQIGRTLDFPTVNIALNRLTPCLRGIYGVDVQTVRGEPLTHIVSAQSTQTGIQGYLPESLFGAGHVGTRPAIEQQQPTWRLEVHLPEVSANLYGLLMRVTFLHYLHDEKNYPSLDALKAGIADDVVQLRQFREQHQNFPIV